MCEETVGKNFQEIHSLLWLSNGSFGVNAPNLKPKNQKAVDLFIFSLQLVEAGEPREKPARTQAENMQIPY